MRIVLVAAAALAATPFSAQPASFRLEGTTIQQIHSAFRDPLLTCRALVEA